MRIAAIITTATTIMLCGCAGTGEGPRPVASTSGSAPVSPVPRPAAPVERQTLDWSRLEAAVNEAAKDKKMKIPPGGAREAAMNYARDINRIPVEEMQQYHLDRATIVLEREVFSGVTLAEGAALRGTVSGGGGGGGGSRTSGMRNSTRGSRSTGTTTTGNRSGAGSNPF